MYIHGHLIINSSEGIAPITRSVLHVYTYVRTYAYIHVYITQRTLWDPVLIALDDLGYTKLYTCIHLHVYWRTLGKRTYITLGTLCMYVHVYIKDLGVLLVHVLG